MTDNVKNSGLRFALKKKNATTLQPTQITLSKQLKINVKTIEVYSKSWELFGGVNYIEKPLYRAIHLSIRYIQLERPLMVIFPTSQN